MVKEKYRRFIEKYGYLLGSLLFTGKVVRRPFADLFMLLIRHFGSVKNHVVFTSYPDYSDNSKALSDYLISAGYTKKYRIYWLVSNPKYYQQEYSDKGITFLPSSSIFEDIPFSSIRIHVTAKYVFATHFFSIVKPKGLKQQQYIRLWHGCGYKDNDATKTYNQQFFDVHLVPGDLFVKTKSKFWNLPDNYFLPIGLPRFDWLKYPSGRAKEMYKYFKGDNMSVVVWMPTFRNSRGKVHSEDCIKGFPIMKRKEDWNLLDVVCKKCKVKILIKLHPFQKEYGIDFSALENIQEINNSDFKQRGIEMYEFLSFSDALISDYSSVAIDYLLTDKPIAFTLDDFKTYGETRGFVFENPLQYMPGHHLYNRKDLENFVKDVSMGKDLYKGIRFEMRKAAIFEADNYCQYITDKLCM